MIQPSTQAREVQHCTGKCSVSGRELKEGEEFYTVLFEQGESFVRMDYSLEAWAGPPARAYCFFKTRMPVKEKKKRLLVDNEVLVGFFERLAEETDPVRVQFRFVLALILMRKRLLRYEGSQTRDGAEVWTVMMARDHSTHRVVNPQLAEEQIAGVSEQLSAILHSDAAAWAEEGAGAGSPPPIDQGHDAGS